MEILDKYANNDMENNEEIHGIWRISKNTKNYAPNKLTLNIKSIYHDDNILTLNEYKEEYFMKKMNEMIGSLPPVPGATMPEMNFYGMLMMMISMTMPDLDIELMQEFFIEFGITEEEELYSIDKETFNKFLKKFNLGTKEEMLYESYNLTGSYKNDYISLNDYANFFLKMAGYTDENILEIEREYEQYVQNYETNINIPEEIKNERYVITYMDGTTEEIVGSELCRYEKNCDISENGKQIINIEETNENQQIEIEVKNIIKTSVDDAYIYIPYSKGYAIIAKDKTLTSYTKEPKMTIDNIPVNIMRSMFKDCEVATTINLGNIDTSKVINMSSMFSGCKAVEKINLEKINTSNVKYMNNMFLNCNALINLDVSNFKTENVKDMGQMFNNCNALVNLDISNFDTRNVTTMYRMFNSCNALVNLDVSNFNTRNVTDMSYMFRDCYALKQLDVSGFVTDNVTDMQYMFTGLFEVESLDVSNFNTSKVIKMNSMFCNCRAITSLNLEKFDTSNVSDMKWIFWHCWNLQELDLRSFNTNKVTDFSQMFFNCTSLNSIAVGNGWVIQEGANTTDMFKNCKVDKVD